MRVYRDFAATAGPLYTRIATALSENEDALRAIQRARKRNPAVILAALHYLALAERPRLSPGFPRTSCPSSSPRGRCRASPSRTGGDSSTN